MIDESSDLTPPDFAAANRELINQHHHNSVTFHQDPEGEKDNQPSHDKTPSPKRSTSKKQRVLQNIAGVTVTTSARKLDVDG